MNIDIDYLYDIYKDEYSDERNEEVLSKEEFIATIETIIEDQIRAKEF